MTAFAFGYIKNRFIIPVCVFAFIAVSAQAQERQENPFAAIAAGDSTAMGLRDAVMTALEHNPTVTIQRLAPDIAETYHSERRELFDPTINMTASQNKTKLQRFLGTNKEPVEMTWDRSNYNINFSETLPTGTSITGTASMSGSLSSLYTDQFSGIIGVTMTQSLLQGFGFGANLASLRKAALDVEISYNELKAVAEEVVANVEKAYWNLYLSEQEILIQEQSLALADRQLQETMERVAVGKLSELELAAVHAETATRREALIDAQSSAAKAQMEFVYMMNPPDVSSRPITPVLVDKPFVPTDSLDTIAVHETLGIEYRADLRQARLNLRKGELDVRQTKNGLLPKLDFYITFNRTTYSESSLNDAKPDIGSPFYDITGGLTFSLPAAKRAARAQFARAKYTQRQREMSVGNLERLVRMDVRSAYIETVRAKRQIDATRITRELQEKNLDAELEKFRVGKSTNYLVLQAQRDFTSSRRDEVRSMVVYLNSLIDLYLMEGTLLERRGIETPQSR